MIGRVVSILGKHWDLQFCKRLPRLPDGRQARGWCDPPSATGKTIKIRDGMSPYDTLRTLIHECQHAADWTRDEEFLDRFADDLATIIEASGWELVNKEE